jgi:hypothetical protein
MVVTDRAEHEFPGLQKEGKQIDYHKQDLSDLARGLKGFNDQLKIGPFNVFMSG